MAAAGAGSTGALPHGCALPEHGRADPGARAVASAPRPPPPFALIYPSLLREA